MITRTTLIGSLAILLISSGCNPQPSKTTPMETSTPPAATKARLGGRPLAVEIITSPEQMARGLSGRQHLPENQGLLFDYQGKKNIPSFWMPDMNFNIDIVWISDKKIVGIEHNVPALKVPKSELPRYQPAVPVDMVLEVNAGWCKTNQIKSGDELVIPK